MKVPALILLAVAPAAAQPPDLQGIWVNSDATPLERPKALEGKPFLTDAEVTELKKRAHRLFRQEDSDYASGDNVFLAALGNVERYHAPATGGIDNMIEREFDNRTSLVVDPPDGKMPPFTPEGQQRRKTAADAAARALAPVTALEDITNLNRCITYGVPRLGGNFGAGPYSYFQILQTPGYVVFFAEMPHEARIIPLDGRPHLPRGIRQWTGDSRGHWEGKTLVVDTANFSPKSNFMGSAENLHLVERFTRIAPDKLKYDITVDDPTTWTRPWTAPLRLKQTNQALYEFACHEGNYDVMHGMLGAAQADDKGSK